MEKIEDRLHDIAVSFIGCNREDFEQWIYVPNEFKIKAIVSFLQELRDAGKI